MTQHPTLSVDALSTALRLTIFPGLLLIVLPGCVGNIGLPQTADDTGLTGDATEGDSNTTGDLDSSGDTTVVGAPTLSAQYPGDEWDTSNPVFILTSDFEGNMDGWNISSYTGDLGALTGNPTEFYTGSQGLKLSFTLTDLASRGDASIYANTLFTSEQGSYYVRYYMRYATGTARPHHANGTRMYAPGEDAGGTAGLRPQGDSRFNTTVDIDGQGRHFFYTYWHEMRSGRCNDGTAVSGCEGDQGTTYYYGNVFKPAGQTIIDRYQWNCYEYCLKANTPNQYGGEQALWINDSLVGEFKTGTPMGGWLRATFFTEGEWGTGDRQVPFEGYNFRTSNTVKEVRVSLALYQEQGTLTDKRSDTPNKTEEQAVFYDDVVIAKERIGCRVLP